MCGLAQAGLLANDLLENQFAKHGFARTQHIPGLWKYHSNPIQFTSVVDGFWVKYNKNQYVQYLIKVFREHYEGVSVDWSGEIFYGIKLDWDYKNRTVDLSMPGYMDKLLQKFLHPTPKVPEYETHQHVQPQYGTKVQFTEPEDKISCYNPRKSPNSNKS